jgi:hypothetical protein
VSSGAAETEATSLETALCLSTLIGARVEASDFREDTTHSVVKAKQHDISGTEDQIAKPSTNAEQSEGDLWVRVSADSFEGLGVFLDALQGVSGAEGTGPEGRAEELKVSIPQNAVFPLFVNKKFARE